jgi:CubicO group peptidase (beta-lactamase class C family)
MTSPELARLACALVFAIAAAPAGADAPVCPNPPPAIATDGLMRHPEVAAAVRELAAEVERDRLRAGLASVAFAVVHGDTVLLAAGYGCANLARGTPATADTLYRVGSVTKLFEATALMQLRDGGRLSLDDPVAKSVPAVWFSGPTGERAFPTWRQLASHTSGLPRNVPLALGTAAELFRYLERERAVSSPGASYAYSNLGFIVLGQSLAELAGERYHAYLRQHIFEPLGMTSSTFDAGAVAVDRLAAGYLRLERAGEHWSGYTASHRHPFAPSGTLLSSVNDIGRFIALQFRRPQPGEQPVLAPATIREMWRPVAAIGPLGGAAAIGWFVSPYGPYTLVRKDGGLPGFTAHVALVPEARLGAVAFVNESPERVRASGANVGRLERLVFERLLPPVTRAAAREPPDQATGAVARMDGRAANPSYQRASAGREGRQSSSP